MKKIKKINVAFYSEWDDIKPWKNKLEPKKINLLQWPNEIIEPKSIEIALVWDAPNKFWKDLTNLKFIQSLGAGVDHIKTDQIDKKVKISRLVDPNLSEQMAEYAIMGVLLCQRDLFSYLRQKNYKLWKQLKASSKDEFIVTILGYGKIGRFINKQLCLLGFKTRVWTRTKKSLSLIGNYYGYDQLNECIKGSQCLISLLPLTEETKNILNLKEFKSLGRNGYFINIGRGKTVNEYDLSYALKHKIIKGAILDVFNNEPLKKNHPFWNMNNIILTPHIAAVTRVTDYAVETFTKNIKSLYKNKRLKNLVSKKKGY